MDELQFKLFNHPKSRVFLTFVDILVLNGNSSLSYIVDLKTMLPEWVSVGFSGATSMVTELHTILS